MKKGQIHPSVKVYQNYIVKAFLSLLKDEKAENITITKICEQADVSRRTFYRHFENKEAIIECYAAQLMASLADTLTISYLENDFSSFTNSFFHFFFPLKATMRCLADNNFMDILFTSYIKSMTPLYDVNTKENTSRQQIPHSTECKMAYTLGGLWSLLTYWLSTGCRQTPEELSELIG